MHAWSIVNPDLELQLDNLKRKNPLSLGTLEALDAAHGSHRRKVLELYEETLTTQLSAPAFQLALEMHSKLEARADDWRDHAGIREAVACKLDDVARWLRRELGRDPSEQELAPYYWYVNTAQKLVDARRDGLWYVDPVEVDEHDPEAGAYWYTRAGFVKLCPSDARREGYRLGRLYGDRVKALDQLGYVLRYCVISLPNFPQWHLAAGVYTIRKLIHDKLTHALVGGGVARNLDDPRRLFPDLVGAVFTIEAPLSSLHATDPSNAWNVHVNAILVFKPAKDQPYGRPDYEPIRAAWGADMHFAMIPQGDPDATDAALKELFKYPVKMVAEKSPKPRCDQFGNVLPPAPAFIEWPECYVDEWIRAFKGVRRTWAVGELNKKSVRALDGKAIELPPPRRKRNLDRLDFLGTIKLSPALCSVSRPLLDTREEDRARRVRQFEHRARLSIDPGYAAAERDRELRYAESLAHSRRRQAAISALFTLIHGNTAARSAAATVIEASSAPRGPPT